MSDAEKLATILEGFKQNMISELEHWVLQFKQMEEYDVQNEANILDPEALVLQIRMESAKTAFKKLKSELEKALNITVDSTMEEQFYQDVEAGSQKTKDVMDKYCEVWTRHQGNMSQLCGTFRGTKETMEKLVRDLKAYRDLESIHVAIAPHLQKRIEAENRWFKQCQRSHLESQDDEVIILYEGPRLPLTFLETCPGLSVDNTNNSEASIKKIEVIDLTGHEEDQQESVSMEVNTETAANTGPHKRVPVQRKSQLVAENKKCTKKRNQRKKYVPPVPRDQYLSRLRNKTHRLKRDVRKLSGEDENGNCNRCGELSATSLFCALKLCPGPKPSERPE